MEDKPPPPDGTQLRCLYDYAGDASVGTPALRKDEHLTLVRKVSQRHCVLWTCHAPLPPFFFGHSHRVLCSTRMQHDSGWFEIVTSTGLSGYVASSCSPARCPSHVCIHTVLLCSTLTWRKNVGGAFKKNNITSPSTSLPVHRGQSTCLAYLTAVCFRCLVVAVRKVDGGVRCVCVCVLRPLRWCLAASVL